MIYYFSATGNSEHVANRLGAILNEDITNITHDKIIDKSQRIIIVCPLFFWGLPKIVESFIKWSNLDNNNEVFLVYTYGGFIGSGDKNARNIIKPAKSFIYGIPMETNYIVWHKVDEDLIIDKKLKKAEIKIDEVAKQINNKENGYTSLFITRLIGKLFVENLYEKMCSTKPFYVSDKCIKCNKCIENCPDYAIDMVNNEIKWVKDTCQNCLKCIHNCPTLAIEYGDKTVGKKRYLFKNHYND